MSRPVVDARAGASVVRLSTTAIKGFGMQESSAVLLTARGVPGDRAFFVVDRAGKLVSATRTACFLPYWARFDPELELLTVGRGESPLLSEKVRTEEPVRAHFFGDRYATGVLVSGPWGRLLSDIAGQPLRLVRARDPLGGYDVHRVSLMSEASAWALGRETDDAPLDSRRFRMTLTVGGVPPFTEDGWVNDVTQVGDSVVRFEKPVRRCAAIQKHPDGLENQVDPLRRIKEVRGAATSDSGRGLHLGVYGEVVEPGLVRVGDEVRPHGRRR